MKHQPTAAQGENVSDAQQVPVQQVANPVVQQVLNAGRKATRARNQVVQPPCRYRKRPGTKALQEIRREQKSTQSIIPLAPFIRLEKEVGDDFKMDLRWQTQAIMALRDFAKMYLIGYFDDTNLAAIHAKRVTIMKRDMKLVGRLRTPFYGGQ